MPEAVLPGGTSARERVAFALDHVARRVLARDVLLALSAAAPAGALASLIPLDGPRRVALAAGVVAAAAGLVSWSRRRHRTRPAIARRIEHASREWRNLLITAEELIAHPGQAKPWIEERVLAQAAGRLGDLPVHEAARLRSPLVLCITSLGLSVLLASAPWRLPDAAGDADSRASAASRPSSGIGLRVTIRPPAYTGLTPREIVDPERIAAIAGSMAHLQVSAAHLAACTIRFGATEVPTRSVSGGCGADLPLGASGYVAIDVEREGGRGDARRWLLPVVVTPDATPAVRIDVPARDMVVAPSAGPIQLRASASDDFGLRTLEFRYTKVSGTGEDLEFVEGTLPASVARDSPRGWRAEARIALDALRVAPGDSLVYRAVARDARAGDAGFGSSDTFFVEVAGPGQAVLDGLEMRPDEERYALSQQMIVLKIQRLRRRERVIARPAFTEEASAIAAEQRSVRGNFIFLLGGEVEDEFEEAEHSHEIQEGRLENTARREISSAVHHMTRTERGLTALNTGEALGAAKLAVEALQRAFGRSRYLLRTVPVRNRLDPARRLTGSLDAISDWMREPADDAGAVAPRAARRLLASLLDIAGQVQAGRLVDAALLAGFAEQALAIDPASAEWQEIAVRIDAVREAVTTGRDVGPKLNDAIGPVARAVRQGAPVGALPGTRAPSALIGAWAGKAER